MGVIDYQFAYASLIGHITIKADGIILSPSHSYQTLSIAHFSFFLFVVDDDHKILGDGRDSVADTPPDF